MSSCKVVFDCNNDGFGKYSPHECISIMNKLTDSNGELYVREWTDCSDPTPILYKCKLNWNKENIKMVKATLSNIYNAIKEVAKIEETIIQEAKDVDEDWLYTTSDGSDERLREELENRLPEHLQDFYNTFLRDWNFGGEDFDEYQIEEIMKNSFFGIELSPEEQDIYDKVNELKKQDILTRIKEGPSCSDVIIRSKRIFKLMELGAPDIIITNECRYLAQALTLYLCASEKEEVKDIK